MNKSQNIGVGLLGLGVVGSGVARFLSEKSKELEDMVGLSITLKGVLVRDIGKQRQYEVPPTLLSSDANHIINNPDVNVVMEVMGGRDPAHDYILNSISLGKHVVTANKEVMARHGPDILAAARKKGTHVMFEASVGGGIPIISPLLHDLVANDVIAVRGIINGTTNYILTRMAKDGIEFDAALKETQELGYAEANPDNDVEGVDAACKLAILATIAFRAGVRDTDVYREGITRLKARDFLYARELGYSIKLISMARKQDGRLQARTHPVFVPNNVLMGKVDGVLNAIEIETDLAGRVLFHGRGAGALPTTSAMLADLVNVSRNIVNNARQSNSIEFSEHATIMPMRDLETKYYLRMSVSDSPGVLAQITKILGDLQISISSVIQKKVDDVAHTAEIVLMTHLAKENSMQRALESLRGLQSVDEIGNMVRVEDWI